MRPLELEEKKALYKFTKTILVLTGSFLIVYGCYILASGLLSSSHDPGFWFGIFPAYIGSMMILMSLAMKVEWFTDARRFW